MIIKKISFLFFMFFSLSIIQAQCNQPILKTISFTNGLEVETSYCGSINDRGQRNGKGRLDYINFEILYEEGIWKSVEFWMLVIFSFIGAVGVLLLS